VKSQVQPQTLPDMLIEEQKLDGQTELALIIREDSREALEILIKWKKILESENSWESTSRIQ